MPLAKRIIPTLLVRGRQLVKGQQFQSWRSVGHVGQAVRIHQARGVDELVLLDIAATPEGRGPDLKLVEELTKDCFMPLAVGGGVRTVQDVKDLLRAGADKVVIGTGAWQPVGNLVGVAADKVGSQAIVVSVDVLFGYPTTHRGTQPIATHPARYADFMAHRGAGEILLTSVEREGTMRGYDLDLIREVSGAVGVPVIAHGGAGTYQHMLEAIEVGADAVAAGALFQFCEATPRDAAIYLKNHGIETRV